MRIAVLQGPADAATVEENLSAIAAAAASAADLGADLLVTPEMSATGYNIGAESARRAEHRDGPIASAISQLAQQHRIAILYGYPEITDAGNHNTVVLVGADGTALARHHKTHLFGELDHGLFVAGDELVTQVELSGLTCGLAICYEVEFPELVRAHAESGTDLLLVPTGLMAPFDVVSRILVPARAYENQMFVVYANRCGVENGLDYCGQSVVVGPDGADLARAGRGETLLVADVEADALIAGRGENTHLADRRLDLYPAPTRPQS
ncbi:carbon-nitrogen hydrolase family protein [Gordonia sp. TBRC 11910]|uniref:Carbon-nitrogen hydrolase family protein n=1 Tax=Gordonia asplenii TaxID=2725283 RepID=A0A848KVA9_9ACTN|nr:carbon-nitrogen hydrolase family protein [Gordonia asplenii]NMO02480.1 carbon-nitrogen hydrolase family protein [Gordonia asplenii]